MEGGERDGVERGGGKMRGIEGEEREERGTGLRGERGTGWRGEGGGERDR